MTTANPDPFTRLADALTDVSSRLGGDGRGAALAAELRSGPFRVGDPPTGPEDRTEPRCPVPDTRGLVSDTGRPVPGHPVPGRPTTRHRGSGTRARQCPSPTRASRYPTHGVPEQPWQPSAFWSGGPSADETGHRPRGRTRSVHGVGTPQPRRRGQSHTRLGRGRRHPGRRRPASRPRDPARLRGTATARAARRRTRRPTGRSRSAPAPEPRGPCRRPCSCRHRRSRRIPGRAGGDSQLLLPPGLGGSGGRPRRCRRRVGDRRVVGLPNCSPGSSCCAAR